MRSKSSNSGFHDGDNEQLSEGKLITETVTDTPIQWKDRRFERQKDG